MTMLENPDRAAEFISMNCSDGIVESPLSTFYFGIYVNFFYMEPFLNDPRGRLLMCLGPTSLDRAAYMERCDFNLCDTNILQQHICMCMPVPRGCVT